MKPYPKISVLMSVYNGDKYLREAIESILNQSFDDFEFIIINDASTDKSIDIIKSFNDKRILLINNEINLGLTKNLNRGIDLAKGIYIARMDVDDISHKDRFIKQIDFLKRNIDISLCGTLVSYFGHSNYLAFSPVFHNEIKFSMLSNNSFAHPSVMWRKKDFESNGLRYNEEFYTAQDYELFSRVVQKLKTANISEHLLYYRTHDSQISKTKIKNQEYNARCIKLNQLKYLYLQPSEKEIKAHLCLFDHYFEKYNDIQTLIDADEWMLKIYLANRKLLIYNEKLLLDFWKSKLFGSALYEYDLNKWRFLISSNCVNYCNVSISNKFYLFIKCLLRWNVKTRFCTTNSVFE